MKKFLTHNLDLYLNLNAQELEYNQKIYKCAICNILLYEHCHLNIFYEVISLSQNNVVNYFYPACELKCNEYIVKNIIE